MRNGIGIGIGILLLAAAFLIAANETTPKPAAPQEMAAAFVTALHGASTPAPQPSSTATAWRQRGLGTSIDSAVRLIFQEPYQDKMLVRCCDNALLQPVAPRGSSRRGVLVTGSGAVLTDGQEDFTAAFGAVLMREQDQYALRFRTVKLGPRQLKSTATLLPNGSIRFQVRQPDVDPEMEEGVWNEIYVRPCSASQAPVESDVPLRQDGSVVCY